MYKMLFDSMKSVKAYEEDLLIDEFGLAAAKPEGANIAYEDFQEGYKPKHQPVIYAKGFKASYEAMANNLYGVFKKKAQALGKSLYQTEENLAANVYNRGFNSSYLQSGGDGVELFSTAHVRGPSDSTTYSNELATPASLSEASLEEMTIQIEDAVDAKGLKIHLSPEHLIIPTALRYEACRILKSTLQNDTANNALNAMKYEGVLAGTPHVNKYLSSTTAWFIKTDCPSGMIRTDREGIKFDQDGEFDAFNTKFKAWLWVAFGWSDPRGAYGSLGTS